MIAIKAIAIRRSTTISKGLIMVPSEGIEPSLGHYQCPVLTIITMRAGTRDRIRTCENR